MYSDVHRILLQACANNGCLKINNALQILEKAIEGNQDQENEINKENLKKYIKEINNKISNMGQKLEVIKHEFLKEDFLVFANTVQDSINEFQLQYNPAELMYLRILLRKIVEHPEHCLKIILAINSVCDVKEKNIPKAQAENLLDNWKNLGYFIIENDCVWLGPRAIVEYGNVLKLQFPNEIQTCPQCKVVVFYGVKCGNENCETSFHRNCVAEHLTHFSDCPSCKTLWKGTK
ncbi:non-structural maintenance of chromosomes element 1 homolog [Condylostylus longicornis]|uniref:non-structural maintenance of chromosomes element 1 homolog n=1 Tax=Condylostylus longicornis TaxID=2530218 RepID=UPI00244DC21E|nr:non-structural maintenance of chromosomes element 1 homolog [Condylostylus longicornis]